MSFKSSFTKKFEESVKKRHYNVLTKLMKEEGIRYYEYGDLKFRVYPTAFSPHSDAKALSKILEKIKKPGDVLDLGTGSGILALTVAKNAKNVLAVDINKQALKSVRESAKLNNIKNIKIKYSDVFSNVKGKFDTIIFNAPFRYFKPKNIIDRAMTDHDYKTLTKFFKNVKDHLKDKGKIYLIFSNSGDLIYLNKLIKKTKLKSKLIKKVEAPRFRVDVKIYYYIYEIKK